jgi:hypothetical protein
VNSVSAWEAIFLLVVLKIPMLYLAAVVWWAIRAEPLPGDGYEPVTEFVPLTPCSWDDRRRRRPGGRRPPTYRPAGPRGRRPARASRRVGVAA